MKEKGHEKSRNPIYHPTLILEPVSKGRFAIRMDFKRKGNTPHFEHPGADSKKQTIFNILSMGPEYIV